MVTQWVQLISLVTAAGLAAAFPAWTLATRYRRLVYGSPEEVPPRCTALVFGAGYWPDGTPSDVMKDRVEAAVELYHAGRVQRLLFSGARRPPAYNEPERMRDYALSLELPERAVTLDYRGWRTYDSCHRARVIFGLQEAVLVSQRYHLPRALYICRGLGLDAVGYAADRRPYVDATWYWAREVPALWLAWRDVHGRRRDPAPGEPIPTLEGSDGSESR